MVHFHIRPITSRLVMWWSFSKKYTAASWSDPWSHDPMPDASAGFIRDHLCRQTYNNCTQATEAAKLETDYSKLYTTVQCHAHTPSCMRNCLCQFHFPFSYSDETTIEWVPDSNNTDIWILRVITKRNDRWAVMHPHLMLQAHRANVNAQVILELRVHLDYVTKYATKIEEKKLPSEKNTLASAEMDNTTE